MRSMKKSPAVAPVMPAERPSFAAVKKRKGPVRACEAGGEAPVRRSGRPACDALHGMGTPRGYPRQRTDNTHWASVCASALVSCVLAGIGTLPHTPTLPFTIDCAR